MIHAIIPAGGAGTRLWPLSRRNHPKFLLPLNDPSESLLQQTVKRLTPVSKSITVVTGDIHREAVRSQLPPEVRVVAEPLSRNSMPAIGLAAALIRRQWGDEALIGSFAADHAIADTRRWCECVSVGATLADGGDYLVTLGITPTCPATGYGYIRPDGAVKTLLPVEATGDSGPSDGADRSGEKRASQPVCWWEVNEFVEKPAESAARKMVQAGCLWNAGVFICRVGFLLAALERLHPHLAAGLDGLANSWDDFNEAERLSRFQKLPAIAIDHALAEPLAEAGQVLTVAVEPGVGWADLGDFTALKDRPHPYQQSAFNVDSRGAVAVGQVPAKPVVVVGIDDCIVVETDSALLVTTAQSAQKVGKVGQMLCENGYDWLR